MLDKTVNKTVESFNESIITGCHAHFMQTVEMIGTGHETPNRLGMSCCLCQPTVVAPS
jgi:hypothetical protein